MSEQEKHDGAAARRPIALAPESGSRGRALILLALRFDGDGEVGGGRCLSCVVTMRPE